MIPKAFAKDIAVWRKWKETVTKHFGEQEATKYVVDATARSSTPVGSVMVKGECDRNPTTSQLDQLCQTEGEVHKLVRRTDLKHGDHFVVGVIQSYKRRSKFDHSNFRVAL